MRLIKPSLEIINQESGINGVYKQIELAGRTCYKSEDRITEGSAKKFVDMMIKSGHGAMLEHGTVYLRILFNSNMNGSKYLDNKYSKHYVDEQDNEYITTNLRVLVENNWLDDLKYICDPTKYHEKRITVKFICDRGVSHEFVRHRTMSFAQESTRYCNYSKDKFGNEITYIIPSWMNIHEGQCYWKDGIGFREGADLDNQVFGNIERGTDTQYQIFLHSLQNSENYYFDLLKQWDNKVPDKRYTSGFQGNPWSPQQARQILPNALKTELVMTGFISDWKHFLSLRSPKYGATGMHPDAAYLADMLYDRFTKEGFI